MKTAAPLTSMMMAIDQFWSKFALALLNQSMNYNQTHNFLCISDQVIENIGNCKQFRLVSDFLFKSHVQFMVYLLVLSESFPFPHVVNCYTILYISAIN